MASKSAWRQYSQSFRWRKGQHVRIVRGYRAGDHGRITRVQGRESGHSSRVGAKVQVRFGDGDTAWYHADASLDPIGGSGSLPRPNPLSTDTEVALGGGAAILVLTLVGALIVQQKQAQTNAAIAAASQSGVPIL